MGNSKILLNFASKNLTPKISQLCNTCKIVKFRTTDYVVLTGVGYSESVTHFFSLIPVFTFGNLLWLDYIMHSENGHIY